MMNDPTYNPVWHELRKHHEALKTKRLAELVLDDKSRLQNCQLACGPLRMNYALNFVTDQTLELLMNLARAQDVEGWRERMLGGEKINITENRAALHMALRQPDTAPLRFEGRDIMGDIRATQKRVLNFVDAVREGKYKGATGKVLRHVVNIGIGGSDLGPRLAVGALALEASGPEVHFIANVDAFELVQLLNRLDPEETLFVVVSKTFTTQETMMNAHTARDWLVDALGTSAIEKHFVAVSSNLDAVKDFGITASFPMWDWVGGRFSLWSAVGISIALAVGSKTYIRLLQGAAAMDDHFRTAPLNKNMPVVLAMLGIWARNFMGATSHAVLPYSQRLKDLPRYLQQLEMESNGKTVSRDGNAVSAPTTPVLFGECGTVGQHGFHQWLHQGSDVATADFIGITQDDLGHGDHHQALLTNLTAQVGALAFGLSNPAKPWDMCAGNRPSTLLMLDKLDAYGLGMLLALYEHKVFVQSVVWNINCFDQPGVELGKKLARSLADGAALPDAEGVFLQGLYTHFVAPNNA